MSKFFTVLNTIIWTLFICSACINFAVWQGKLAKADVTFNAGHLQKADCRDFMQQITSNTK